MLLVNLFEKCLYIDHFCMTFFSFTALHCCISNLINTKSEGFEVNILLTVNMLLHITMQVNYDGLIDIEGTV